VQADRERGRIVSRKLDRNNQSAYSLFLPLVPPSLKWFPSGFQGSFWKGIPLFIKWALLFGIKPQAETISDPGLKCVEWEVLKL
jgi:hypothetical protein